MIRADVVILITESPEAHGVYDQGTDTRRTALCSVKSVGMSETYKAMSQGLTPEYVLILSAREEYQGERRCEYDGIEYDIIRSYVTDADTVELTIQRRGAHV